MNNNIEISSIIKKRTLGLVFVLGAASLAFAQEKVNIAGKIVDKNNAAVPYASVTFSNKTDKLLSDAVLTDESGNYKVAIAPGNYDVIIEAIDYKKFTITKLITPASKDGNFIIEKEASATMTPTKEIEGVTIIAASTKAYKVELDKKVYDVSQDIVSKGGSLQDILNNVPSVTVDTDGSVSMRGNSNVRFLINGKPSSLLGIDDGANALQTIPAEQIERIEVISNPSSKYEASGTAGILNIILKKDKKMGFNGTVTGSLGYLPRTNLNTNLNWRKGNWSWFVNGGGGYNKNESSSFNNTFQKTDVNDLADAAFPFTQTSIQDGKTKREGQNYNVNAGLVHDISERTSVNLSGMIRSFNNDQETNNDYNERIFSNKNSYSDTFRNRLSEGNNKNFATQVDFGIDQKLDDNGQNLTLSGSVQSNKSEGINLITTNSYIDNVWQNSGYKVNNVNTDSKSNTFIGKADYELPIGEVSRFEAGARYDFNKNEYDYFVTQSLDGSSFDMMKNFTSNTVYKENILGVYAQFKSKLGEKFAYQLGLRSETSSIDINFDSYDVVSGLPKNEQVKKEYTKLFPTVFLSYDLGNQDQLLVNYSRRINRPRAFSLIPFMSFDDDRNFFRGNPDLNPTYENSFELGYSISKKKFTINPTLYYKKSEDEQNRFQYLDEAGAINTVPFNVGSEQNYGLDLNGTYDPFTWWKMMVSADLYGYKNEGEMTYMGVTNDFSGDGFSYRLRYNNTFRLDRTFSVQIQSFYRAGEKTAMNNRKAMYGVDLGVSKTIWKGDGTISMNLRDVFNTRRMRNNSNTPQFTREMEMQWQPRQISVSLTYKFKQGEKIETRQKPKKDINNNFNGEEEMGGGGQM